jgi:hypothetical protein
MTGVLADRRTPVTGWNGASYGSIDWLKGVESREWRNLLSMALSSEKDVGIPSLTLKLCLSRPSHVDASGSEDACFKAPASKGSGNKRGRDFRRRSLSPEFVHGASDDEDDAPSSPSSDAVIAAPVPHLTSSSLLLSK